MRVGILCVGGVRGSLRGAVSEYEERAHHYWRLDVTELPAGLGRGRKAQEGEVVAAEAERLLAHLSRLEGEIVALTREGREMGSRELARFLSERAVRSTPGVTFVIGGAFGLGEEVLQRCHRKLALSSMTLPHEVARLLLAEQLYRAGTILRNEPYHKGP